MLKKLAFLGLFSAISALSANYAAQAAVFNINSLDFGDGFVASGTITTDDTTIINKNVVPSKVFPTSEKYRFV